MLEMFCGWYVYCGYSVRVKRLRILCPREMDLDAPVNPTTRAFSHARTHMHMRLHIYVPRDDKKLLWLHVRVAPYLRRRKKIATKYRT
jgi:hypothetical protein